MTFANFLMNWKCFLVDSLRFSTAVLSCMFDPARLPHFCNKGTSLMSMLRQCSISTNKTRSATKSASLVMKVCHALGPELVSGVAPYRSVSKPSHQRRMSSSTISSSLLPLTGAAANIHRWASIARSICAVVGGRVGTTRAPTGVWRPDDAAFSFGRCGLCCRGKFSASKISNLSSLLIARMPERDASLTLSRGATVDGGKSESLVPDSWPKGCASPKAGTPTNMSIHISPACSDHRLQWVPGNSTRKIPKLYTSTKTRYID